TARTTKPITTPSVSEVIYTVPQSAISPTWCVYSRVDNQSCQENPIGPVSTTNRFLKSDPNEKNCDNQRHPILKDHAIQRVLLRQILQIRIHACRSRLNLCADGAKNSAASVKKRL